MKNFDIRAGFTRAKYKKGVLTITHNGNMGNSIEMSVNPNLKLLNIETIQELKDKHEVISEVGSPDYSYTIKFKL